MAAIAVYSDSGFGRQRRTSSSSFNLPFEFLTGNTLRCYAFSAYRWNIFALNRVLRVSAKLGRPVAILRDVFLNKTPRSRHLHALLIFKQPLCQRYRGTQTFKTQYSILTHSWDLTKLSCIVPEMERKSPACARTDV